MKPLPFTALLLIVSWGVASSGYAQTVSSRPTYDSCVVNQISWYLIAENPVSVSRILKERKYSETIPRSKRLARVTRLLPGHRPSTPGKVSDIRLVGLFHTAGRTDTLLMDAMYRCFFGGKQFKLTKQLATLLDVHTAGLNPSERRRIKAIPGQKEFFKKDQAVKW